LPSSFLRHSPPCPFKQGLVGQFQIDPLPKKECLPNLNGFILMLGYSTQYRGWSCSIGDKGCSRGDKNNSIAKANRKGPPACEKEDIDSQINSFKKRSTVQLSDCGPRRFGGRVRSLGALPLPHALRQRRPWLPSLTRQPPRCYRIRSCPTRR